MKYSYFAKNDLLIRHEIGDIFSIFALFQHPAKARGNTLFPRAMLDCHRLGLVDAEKKLMVLTDREYYEAFREDSDGMISGIQILFVKLPE